VVDASGEAPLRASAPDVPEEHALLGFAGVRAFASDPSRSAPLLADALGFSADGEDAWRVAGDERSSTFAYDVPPAERGIPGAGTIHHVAFATRMDEQDDWRLRVAQAGARPTPVIDRFYFRSVYFREPSGCCSSSRPWARASRWTRTLRRSASACRCRRRSSSTGPRWNEP
jgi:glyoxalase family protein